MKLFIRLIYQRSSWGQLFNKKLAPMLLIGIALGVFQQFVGINTVMYYGPIIFQHAGFGSDHAVIFATFGMGVVNTIMSIAALLLVDKIGRRKLLIGGLLVAAVSLGILSSTFMYGQHLAWMHTITLFAHGVLYIWLLFKCRLIILVNYSRNISTKGSWVGNEFCYCYSVVG